MNGLINDIFYNLLPNMNLYNSLTNNTNNIRKIKNNAYDYGLSLLFYNILVDNYFSDDILLEIYFDINLLKENIKVISEHNFIFEIKSEEEIVDYIKTNGFMIRSEAIDVYDNLTNDFFYIDKYITYLNFIQVYERDCLIKQDNTLVNFLNKILNKGYITYSSIN